jgi:hypothetical protein
MGILAQGLVVARPPDTSMLIPGIALTAAGLGGLGTAVVYALRPRRARRARRSS